MLPITPARKAGREFRRAERLPSQISARSASGSAMIALPAPSGAPAAISRWAVSRSSGRPTDSAATTRSELRYQAENSPASRSPRQITSSQSDRTADVLERSPIGKVAEEVGHDRVGGLLPEHPPRRVLALLEGDVPVLDPDAGAAVQLAHVAAAVPGREDPRDRGLEAGVADDPVADLEPGPAGEHRVGPDAGADHHRVAVDRQAALGQDRGHPLVALERGNRLAGDDLDPASRPAARGRTARPRRRSRAT